MLEKRSDKNFEGLSIVGLILCAGSGSRAGMTYNKLLHYVGRKTILEMTLDRFSCSGVTSIVLAVSPADYDTIANLTRNYKNIKLCLGGNTRSESVKAGLKAIGNCDIVVIHDGARPYVNVKTINDSINSAIRYGSGIVATPTVDTIKEVRNSEIVRSLVRKGLYNVQTPQTFIFNRILSAYSHMHGEYTDDSEVYEKFGFVPRIVAGEPSNFKVTSNFDLMHPLGHEHRIGVGFDVHKMVSGRPLILGGINIPYPYGLLGHSDADVLTHAIMDSLLSAANLPDIGQIFPDTDPKFKNADSIELLGHVDALIYRRGYCVGNISAVIMAQNPKLFSYIPKMQETIAKKLKISATKVTISATTTEQLGIIGRGRGIASSATCILFK